MMPWFLPYQDKPDPALAARFHALADLPANTFGNTFATFYNANKYAFPGEPTALNFAFAAPHDSSHTRAGYDTRPRGEAMKVDLFDPSWDFWAATREPIDTVRAKIGSRAKSSATRCLSRFGICDSRLKSPVH